MQHKHAQSALRSPPKAELCVHAQGKASIHGQVGLHGLIAPAAIVRSVRVLNQRHPVIDDAAAGGVEGTGR